MLLVSALIPVKFNTHFLFIIDNGNSMHLSICTKYLQGLSILYRTLGRLSFDYDTCKSNFCLFWHRLVTLKPSACHHGISEAVQLILCSFTISITPLFHILFCKYSSLLIFHFIEFISFLRRTFIRN